MSKIKPTTILPYTKQSVPANSDVNAINISNALSAKPQRKNHTIKNLFGVLTAAAAKYEYIKKETNGHYGTTLYAWRQRKQ